MWSMVALSALLLGVYDVARKHAVRGNAVPEVLFYSSLAGLAGVSGIQLLTNGMLPALSAVSLRAVALLGVKVLLVGSSWGVVFLAMRRLPISLAAPVRATSPFWTLLGAMVLFGEVPGPVRAVGMVLMPVGYVMLSAVGKREGFPWKSREMVLVVIGTLLGAASALYDKHLLGQLHLSPDLVQFLFAVGLSLLYGGVLLARRIFLPMRASRSVFQWRWSILAAGVLLILSDYFYFRAVALEGAPISVISVLRRTSTVVSLFVGGTLFGERFLSKKWHALLFVLLGAFLVALGR